MSRSNPSDIHPERTTMRENIDNSPTPEQEETEKKRQQQIAEQQAATRKDTASTVQIPEGGEPLAKRQERIDYALSTNILGLPNHVLQAAIDVRREAGLPTTKAEEADFNHIRVSSAIPAEPKGATREI